ncbi:MAG: alpha/beta fold hydrolase [Synechococcaceae cyanobacterium]
MDIPARDAPSAPRPLLVGLHGWLLSGRLWEPLARELEPRWQLWAPDLPGFGDCPRPRGLQPSLASYGAWVSEQCRRRHQGPVVLMGHSLGGSIALHAARHLGDRLAGVVQIAAGGGVYQPRPFARVRRGGCLVLRWRPRWLLQVPGSDALRSPLLADLRAARGLLACSMRRSAVSALPRITAELTVPSLWIAGSRDRVMEPRYVRHLAGYAPQHQVTVLDGAGHLPMLQMPQQLAESLSGWLEELPMAEVRSQPQPRPWETPEPGERRR